MKLYVLKVGKNTRIETVQTRPWGDRRLMASGDPAEKKKFDDLFLGRSRIHLPEKGPERMFHTFYGPDLAAVIAGAREALERDVMMVEGKLRQARETADLLDKFLAESEVRVADAAQVD